MKFYIKDDIIYKEITSSDPTHLLKLSPWDMNEDRRIFDYNIKDYKTIDKSKAYCWINRQWDEDNREWEFNGFKYRVYNSFKTCFRYTFENRYSDMIQHEFTTTYKWYNTNYAYKEKYFLCMYQGKIYWVEIGQYCPQVRLYKFIDINTGPKLNDFVRWAKSNHCKKIYKLNTEVQVYECI